MRRTTDNREYAVLTYCGRRIEVHPDIFNACYFLLNDPDKSAKIEIGVMSGNISNVHINGLKASSLMPEPAMNEPLYTFTK
jgi:hypothetical protein